MPVRGPCLVCMMSTGSHIGVRPGGIWLEVRVNYTTFKADNLIDIEILAPPPPALFRLTRQDIIDQQRQNPEASPSAERKMSIIPELLC